MDISFIFGFDGWRHNKYPVATTAPCEGTSYEIGGIALVKDAHATALDIGSNTVLSGKSLAV